MSVDSGGAPFLPGLRVLDVTGALAGPYCTTILSGLSAEVIKIEPVTGDSLRRRTMGADGKPFALRPDSRWSARFVAFPLAGSRVWCLP